jgi:hypothetical protein
MEMLRHIGIQTALLVFGTAANDKLRLENILTLQHGSRSNLAKAAG